MKFEIFADATGAFRWRLIASGGRILASSEESFPTRRDAIRAAEREMPRHFEVALEPAEEGGFTAYVPALRGCVSEGETEEEALNNIQDAIISWLDAWDMIAATKGFLLRTVEVHR
jgi:predicted RNase H-like HicB family nuclease/uncharacterized protein YegP (UPF0339 family)